MKKAFKGAHPPIINAKNCTISLFGAVNKCLVILDSQQFIPLIAKCNSRIRVTPLCHIFIQLILGMLISYILKSQQADPPPKP